MLQFSEDKAIERPTFPPPPTIDPMGIGVEGKKIFFYFLSIRVGAWPQ